jgi:hypothetical protein
MRKVTASPSFLPYRSITMNRIATSTFASPAIIESRTPVVSEFLSGLISTELGLLGICSPAQAYTAAAPAQDPAPGDSDPADNDPPSFGVEHYRSAAG